MKTKKRITGQKKGVAASPSHLSRRRIVETARAHFFQHGFRNVTMDDLAAELRASKKTLYAHFPSKDSLLEAILRDKLQRVRVSLRQARNNNTPFPDSLRASLGAVQSELDELKPPFLRDMRKAPGPFQRQEERRVRLIREHFGQLFRQGQRDGHVREDISPELMIETLLASVHAIMNPPKLNALGLAPKEGFRELIDLLLQGALVRKGGK
ncbi:MAG TPA: TetR/AcrR family transcriptional regulator [Chthoniobacterales bacterium]|jgi:AcrR family transcriptional regulator